MPLKLISPGGGSIIIDSESTGATSTYKLPAAQSNAVLMSNNSSQAYTLSGPGTLSGAISHSNTFTSSGTISSTGTVSVTTLTNANNYYAHSYVRNPSSYTRLATWTSTFTSQTSGSIDAVNTLGYPSGVKAVSVVGFWQIDGYGGSGGADHATSVFGQSTIANDQYYSNTGNVGDVNVPFIMMFDGDNGVAVGSFGFWYNGIIPVNSNGLIYYILGSGLSGGTHYMRLIFGNGYWI